MKRIFVAAFFLCLICQPIAVAASILPSNMTNASPKGFYIGADIGGMFYRVGDSNYLNTGPGWPNDHYASNGISDQISGFLAAGYTWQRQADWLPNYSLGLRYMYSSNTTVSGYIDQYSLPAFRNYHFSYDVQMLSVLATLKANIYRWRNLMPYVLVGAGVASYGTSDYSEQALTGVTPRVSPGFADNSGNNFAYQLGIGIDYAVQENLLINIEFDYIDYGKVQTGNGVNYATLTGTNYATESLKNKITATALFLGLTYYIS
jgi:opacity protein-like surface antigen